MRDTMLRDQGSSVDYLLKAHDSNLPIYSCPLFVTKNSDVIMWGSLLLNPDGFFVKNDVIASEPSLGQEDLYLKSINRFYAIYCSDKTNYIYTFYSLLSCKKLYAYLEEKGEGVGDFIAKVVSSFDETEILGMVCVELGTSTSDKEAIFALLLSKPFVPKTYRLFDALTVMSTIPFDTDSFKLYYKIVLAYSFVHDLKKHSGQENAWVMMNNSEAEAFKSYLDKNYNLLPEEQRNECVLLYTGRKCVRSKVVQNTLLKVCVVNLFNMIKCHGIDSFLSLYSIFGDKKIFNLGKLVGQTIYYNTQSVFAIEEGYLLPLVLALVFVNLLYPDQPGIKNPIGIWLYYFLYKIRKSCASDELPFINTLLEFTLYNNFSVYCTLLGQIKSNVGVSDYFDENGCLCYDWRYKQNNVAVCELFYLFANCQSQRTLFSENEKKIWSATIDKEIERAEILDVLRNDADHSRLSFQEREYFADKLFQFIEQGIESGDFYFKEFY